MNTMKLPKHCEFWRHNIDREIVYIVGFDHQGGVVWCNECAELNSHDFAAFLTYYTHLPDCIGFDWVEKPAIDPGEGWYLLPERPLLEYGDEVYDATKRQWMMSIFCGVHGAKGLTYRRRKPASETWPKYFRGDLWAAVDAYIRFDSADSEGVFVDINGDEKVHNQYKFHGEHGRWPTWKDAIAHLDAETQAMWEDELRKVNQWPETAEDSR